MSLKLSCEHIGLAALSPRKLAGWYEKTFRFRKTMRGNNPEAGPYFLLDENSGFMIEIFLAERVSQTDSVHFCFIVNDIQLAIASLGEDIDVVSELREQEDGSQVFFFRDLEGHILQFIQR